MTSVTFAGVLFILHSPIQNIGWLLPVRLPPVLAGHKQIARSRDDHHTGGIQLTGLYDDLRAEANGIRATRPTTKASERFATAPAFVSAPTISLWAQPSCGLARTADTPQRLLRAQCQTMRDRGELITIANAIFAKPSREDAAHGRHKGTSARQKDAVHFARKNA